MKGVRPESGRIVGGRYRLLDRLGRGSIGEVWLAEHQALGSNVAIKFLRGRAGRDPWVQERFFDEARIAARLQSRHVSRVYDVSSMEDGRPYVVMEYLDGETLEERLRRERRLSPALAARILLQVAKGLAKAHAAGIVHRDIKPENIFLTTDEDGCTEAKVLDFGIAKILGGLDDSSASELPTKLGRTSGRLVGTPTHMAPEQTFGNVAVGPAADVWAFGVVAYECLTGELPFNGGDLAELFGRIRGGDIRDALRGLEGVGSLELEGWFATAFALEPSRRFANMRACAEALAFALRTPMLSNPSMGAMVSAAPSSASEFPASLAPATLLARTEPLPGSAPPPSSRAHSYSRLPSPRSSQRTVVTPPPAVASGVASAAPVLSPRAWPLVALGAMVIAGATGAIVAVRVAPKLGYGVGATVSRADSEPPQDLRVRVAPPVAAKDVTVDASTYHAIHVAERALDDAPREGDEVRDSDRPLLRGAVRVAPSSGAASDTASGIPELSAYRNVPY